MVSRDHKLSMRKQCELLQLSRSRLYYQPVGESAENLRFMEIIDKQFLANGRPNGAIGSSPMGDGMDRVRWPGT